MVDFSAGGDFFPFDWGKPGANGAWY